MQPDNLRYSRTHEWVKAEGDLARVGITDHAQSELGDVVYVELPQVGTATKRSSAFGTLESVKTVSDLISPLSGDIVEVNGELANSPEHINNDPYGAGWIVIIKMSSPKEIDELMTADQYDTLLQEH